jgi:adenylyltransferase/sulfurtransferase
MEFNTIKIRKDPNCPVCGIPHEEVELIDYEQFCGMPAHDNSNFSTAETIGYEEVLQVSVLDLQAIMQSGDDVVVLDVREPHEIEIAAIEGTVRIPKGQIQAAKNSIIAGRKFWEETVLKDLPKDKPLYVHCRSGKRSADSILFLKEAGYDIQTMYNVAGGILAWADEIDPRLPQY